MRQRGTEQLGVPRDQTRHVTRRCAGNAQDEGLQGRHGGHLISVNERTNDEAPGAYKPIKDIIGPIAESVDVIDVMGPSYNLKASQGKGRIASFRPREPM